jgi:catechol 2,3-dioxygenase-like lactoylglutathione lyase family enzyme
MKRFHVNVAVADVSNSVDFYTGLFGVAPTIAKDDYAKWMLDDPRLNFSVSRAQAAAGLRHVGLQFESEGELDAVTARLDAAGTQLAQQTGAECCYARSDKTWLRDPDHVIWELFLTHEQIDSFGADGAVSMAGESPKARSCCA